MPSPIKAIRKNSAVSEADEGNMPLRIRGVTPGRAVFLGPQGDFYLGRRYTIFRSVDQGASWTKLTRMPPDTLRRLTGASRLACRLLRHEVRAMNVLSNGTIVASNRSGVFFARPGEPVMSSAQVPASNQALFPPMTMTVGPDDVVLWGEYNSNKEHGDDVRVFVSSDKGATYDVGYVFPGGETLHVHNIIFDATLDKYWVLTGDHGREPGIGLLSRDLCHFDWVAKGEQRYRAVDFFDLGDHIVYGTDTERAPNAVMAMDKQSGKVERIAELDGSCIYACRFGDIYALSTTVEPSTVNLGREAGLWVSRDAHSWRRIHGAEKDRWHPKLFQFGSIILPRGASNRSTLFFSGQALRGIDGKAMIATLDTASG